MITEKEQRELSTSDYVLSQGYSDNIEKDEKRHIILHRKKYNLPNYQLGDKVKYKDGTLPNEIFEVVGIRLKTIEIKGDFSGGTHNVSQCSWVEYGDIEYATQIISAFPAIGKTYFYNANKGVCLDSDSSKFSWEIKNGIKIRNTEFPKNYIAHIKENLGKVQYILVSSHEEVRAALYSEGLPFTLIYPNKYMKDEILDRMEKRGNEKDFIYLVSQNWDKWISGCKEQVGCKKIVIIDDEYLSDILISNFS